MILHNQTYFYPEAPKLIHPSQLGDYEDGAWVGEPKYDGRRLELHFWNRTWFFWNRHHEIMGYVPNQEITQALNNLNLSGYWIFDGELRHNKVPGMKNKVVLWDIFVSESKLLLGLPFRERRAILSSLGIPTENGTVIGTPPTYRGNFKEVFDSFRDSREIEGLVLKRLDGKLNLGRTRANQSAWMRKARKPSGRYVF